MVSKNIEAPIQKATNFVTDKLNNNQIMSGINDAVQKMNQNIQINYHSTQEETGMIEYNVAYNTLKQ